MKKRTLLPLLGAMALLILDSRCAADAVRSSLALCLQTLIPALFPLFVLCAMLVPRLSGIRLPGLARLLGLPEGSEGLLILGCIGGFPVGAACIAQAVDSGGLSKGDGSRMLGISSFCGPAFLFGIIGTVFSLRDAALLSCIQLETAILTAMLWPAPCRESFHGADIPPVSLPAALKRATASLVCVCGWVTLAGVAAGFLRRWLGPFLPDCAGVLLTGLLELTGGIFSLDAIAPEGLRFVLCAVFVCFGGISVLMQIAGFAAGSGMSMSACIAQKCTQGMLGAALASGTAYFGPAFLLTGILFPAVKIAVEISGRMVYNGPRKEGI